jgi:hypothetical protein
MHKAEPKAWNRRSFMMLTMQSSLNFHATKSTRFPQEFYLFLFLERRINYLFQENNRFSRKFSTNDPYLCHARRIKRSASMPAPELMWPRSNRGRRCVGHRHVIRGAGILQALSSATQLNIISEVPSLQSIVTRSLQYRPCSQRFCTAEGQKVDFVVC